MKLRRVIFVSVVLGMIWAFWPAASSAQAAGVNSKFSLTASTRPGITLTATLSEYHKAKLSWSSAQADGYKVYRSTTKYGSYNVIADVASTTYTDETLLLGKTYYYKISPYTTKNGVSVPGTYSNIRFVAPKWPSIMLRCTLSGTHGAQLGWTKLSYADGYEVQRSTKKSGPYSVIADVTGNAFLDKALAADTTYYYRVRAYDLVNGVKFFGNTCPYRTIKAKWPTVNLAAKAMNYSSVNLSWNALQDVDGFEVLRSTKSSGVYEPIGFAATNTYTDTGLSSSVYFYKVRPYVQANGEKAFGKYSACQSAKPSWPTISIQAEQSESGALLQWNQLSNAKGYEVERSNVFSGPYQKIGDTDGTTYGDKGLSIGSIYYYRVRAYDVVNGVKALSSYSVPVYMRLFETPKPLEGLIIGIDPGHQAHADYNKEPEAPGSGVLKAKVSSGTRGVASKVYEYEVNLSVGLKLKSILESMGATVVMTRETNDINISNAQRAQVFNRYKTDYAIRLHCNGSSNPTVTGAYVLIPTKNPYLPECKKAAQLLIEAVAKTTGAKTYPYVQRSDQAGFNYCERMILNIEMGYMTNAAEDKHLVDESYQQRMAEGIANGILSYSGVE